AKRAKDRSAWIARRADEISRRMSGFSLAHTNPIIRRVALDVAIHELTSIEDRRPMLHGGYVPPLPLPFNPRSRKVPHEARNVDRRRAPHGERDCLTAEVCPPRIHARSRL